MPSKIIDVSSNNGKIDWNAVASDNVGEVIIRLSLGYGDMDKMASDNAWGVYNAGLRVSYYHFAYPDGGSAYLDDAKKEANYFTSLFQAGNLPKPSLLAVDFEKWDKSPFDTSLNKIEFLNWIIKFLDEVNSVTGINCLIYSYKSYLDQHLPSTHPLGHSPLWIANHNKVSTPPLPIGWNEYYLWQYETSFIKGINVPCDMNKTQQRVLFDKLAKKNYLKL